MSVSKPTSDDGYQLTSLSDEGVRIYWNGDTWDEADDDALVLPDQLQAWTKALELTEQRAAAGWHCPRVRLLPLNPHDSRT